MTKAEQRLWWHLRGAQMAGFSFRRQHPIGPYVLDFYCPQLKLAIELDGDQHGWQRNQIADDVRDCWLAKHSITIMRFWNADFLQSPQSVLEAIHNKAAELVRAPTPTQPSPFQGEERRASK